MRIEFLQFRTADSRIHIPSFRLNVNFIKTQLILTNDAINAAITRLMIRFTQFEFRNTISHLFQKVRYHPFKESRCLLHDLIQQLIR